MVYVVVGRARLREAVEEKVSRLRNISTPVSTMTPSGHFQGLLWNSVDKETVQQIDEL